MRYLLLVLFVLVGCSGSNEPLSGPLLGAFRIVPNNGSYVHFVVQGFAPPEREEYWLNEYYGPVPQGGKALRFPEVFETLPMFTEGRIYELRVRHSGVPVVYVTTRVMNAPIVEVVLP